MKTRWIASTSLFVFLLSVALPAFSQDQQESGLRYQQLTALRGNPLGLSVRSQFELWSKLYESDAKVLEKNHVSAGIASDLSPATAAVGPVLELQPLSVLKLWGKYQAVRFFGNFDHFQSFPDAQVEHYDDELDRLGEEGRNYAVWGTRLTLGGLVQLKVGPIAARSAFQAIRDDFDMRSGDTTYFNPTLDILVPEAGWTYTNDADLLWLSDFGLIVGVRDSYTFTRFTGTQLAGGDDPNVPNHRLGALFAYTFFDDPNPVAYDRPTIVAIVSWYLEHRYRAGAESSRALPYVVLGFACTGDL